MTNRHFDCTQKVPIYNMCKLFRWLLTKYILTTFHHHNLNLRARFTNRLFQETHRTIYSNNIRFVSSLQKPSLCTATDYIGIH
jgi:hypothetical protein